MRFLAFDPDQLLALTVRTREVLVALASLPTDDPAAADAERAVREVMRTLQLGLLPVVRRVLDSPPLRAPVDPRDDLDALPAAAIREMAVGRGWAVAVDPREDDPTRITPGEVAALARRLRETEPHEVFDDLRTAAWLAGELRLIAADPALCRSFDHHFGRWAAWADEMAERHRLHGGGAASPLDGARQQLDRLVHAFGRVASGTVDLTDHAADALGWFDDVRPYAAALLLASLDVPLGTFTGLALRTWRRADSAHDGTGPATRDLVLRAVLLHPAAATGFATTAVVKDGLAHRELHHPDLVAQLLVAATDPASATPDDAGRVLVPLLRSLLDGPRPHLRATALADLVAPWTAQFLAADHEWGVSAAERSRMLRAALHDTEAMERFVERADEIVAGARRTFVDGGARSIADFNSYLGAMGVILMDQRVRSTEQRRTAWDTICNIAGMATAFIPWAAVGIVASAAVVVIHNQHTPDVRAAQTESLFMADAALTQAAATVVSTMFATYVRRGYLPDDLAPPPDANPNSGDVTSADYFWRFLDWQDTLPGGIDGDIAGEIRAALYEVISPAQISEHVWWIANGFPGTG